MTGAGEFRPRLRPARRVSKSWRGADGLAMTVPEEQVILRRKIYTPSFFSSFLPLGKYDS
jgi:hypothetical protein